MISSLSEKDELTPDNIRELSKYIKERNKGKFSFENLDKTGKPLKEWENVKALIEHHGIYVMFNEVSKEIEFRGLNGNRVDDCIVDIHSLCLKNELDIPLNTLGSFINRISSSNIYNPVTEFLDEAYSSWSGEKGKIDKVFGALELDPDYDRFFALKLFKRWLVSAVRIAFNDGKQNNEGVLILHGPQGLGKTTWIKSLIPDLLHSYFKDGVSLDTNDKDSVFKTINKWIVELGEIDGTLKKDQASLKAFFTAQSDEQRRPYDKSMSKYPRRTVFFGTVNKDEFLKDETGDRRYWILPVTKIKRNFITQEELKDFWGEVMHMWKSNEEIHYLDTLELEILYRYNERFRVKSALDINIENGFAWNEPETTWTWKKSSEIIAKIKVPNKGIKAQLINCGAQYRRKKTGVEYFTPPYRYDFEMLR